MMNGKPVRVSLTMSDLEIGTKEFGFISREDCRDPDDEDFAYQQHVRKVTGSKAWRVVEGVLYNITEPSK